jgi:hypothetical protein
MITEDFVSVETAKLLREKGFDEPCNHYYDYAQRLQFCDSELSDSELSSDDEEYLAPTQQKACKWLREVHHWHIFVPKWEDVEYMPGEWEETMVGYQYVIINIGEVNRKCEQPTITAFSPESAYEAAIKYCLENLI